MDGHTITEHDIGPSRDKEPRCADPTYTAPCSRRLFVVAIAAFLVTATMASGGKIRNYAESAGRWACCSSR
jgi:hypothetical protein